VSIQFDTTRIPERISVQEIGKNPIHFDCMDGIRETDIIRVRNIAKDAFKIK
jgi:hypothetical protein